MKYFYILHYQCFASFEWVELYKNFSANVYTSPNSGGACFFRASRGLDEEPSGRSHRAACPGLACPELVEGSKDPRDPRDEAFDN